MQFLVTAYDGTDPDAQTRRMAVRADHLANMKKLKAAGNYLIGGAILNDQEKMIGSAMIMDFPDRAALDACLKADPYSTGGVWKDIEIKPYRVAVLDAPG